MQVYAPAVGSATLFTAHVQGHTSTVGTFQLDGNKLISGSSDATMMEWDLRNTSKAVFCYDDFDHGHMDRIRTLQFDNRYLVSGSEDQTVKIW